MGAVRKLKVVPSAPAPRRLPSLTVHEVPKVGDILGYRSVWVLAQLSADRKQLKGTHYAVCLVMGNSPLWAVYTIAGKFIRFAGSRQQIERAYRGHVWRRHPARWTFTELAEKKTIDRKHYMLTKHGG